MKANNLIRTVLCLTAMTVMTYVSHPALLPAQQTQSSAAVPTTNATTAADLVTDSFSGVVLDKHKKPVKISAFRTADLAPGEHFSGVISTDTTDTAQLKNVLYEVVERSSSGNESILSSTPISAGHYEALIPTSATSNDSLLFGRLIKDGKTLATSAPTKIASPPPAESLRNMPKPLIHSRFPEVMQAGRPATIHLLSGDGSMIGTTIHVGGKVVNELAEGPREAIFSAPVENFGRVIISYSKNGATDSGPSSLVAISMTVLSTNLVSGTEEKVRTTITGLPRLDHPLNLLMVNSTPTVELEGGDRQVIAIAQTNVSSDGTYTYDRVIHAEHAGNFNLTDTLLIPGEDKPCNYGGGTIAEDAYKPDGCNTKCKKNYYYFKPDNKGPRIISVTISNPAGGSPISVSLTKNENDPQYQEFMRIIKQKISNYTRDGVITMSCSNSCLCEITPPVWQPEEKTGNGGGTQTMTDTEQSSVDVGGIHWSGDVTVTYEFDFDASRSVEGTCKKATASSPSTP
jgi:hypothetical protein